MNFVHRCLFDCKNYFLRKWFHRFRVVSHLCIDAEQISWMLAYMFQCDVLEASGKPNFYSLTFCDKQSTASKLLVMLTRRKHLQCLGRKLFIVVDDAFPYQRRKDDSEPADLKISIWSCTHHLSQVEWSYGAAAKDVGRKGWRMPAPHRWRSGTWGLPASTGCQRVGISTWMILRIFCLESNSCRWVMIVYKLYLTIKIYQN